MDMSKVNLEVLRSWIVKKVVELIGTEDEVVVNFVMGLLEKDRVSLANYVPRPLYGLRRCGVARCDGLTRRTSRSRHRGDSFRMAS